jgi:hypothetical protein
LSAEAFKLVLRNDQDPASDERIDRQKESKLFWAKERKELKRDIE